MKKDSALDKYIDIIQDGINNKRNLVVFVGAGVSANSNVPTWSQLIDRFAKELRMPINTANDYLKIAQCYFNCHPKKYNKIIKEMLDNDWGTNPITKFLFEEYHPKYFITTNYDCILEKTAAELNISDYKVICRNEDIPKIKNNAIIKMHGDFQNNNIVLKEDDYNEYSQKFKLIETFVKSVFATSIIIFVGFSADDPNVNQIYRWVKDILQSNQNPAFLIQISDTNKIETRKQLINKQYFAKKGIHIINFNDIREEIENLINLNPIAQIHLNKIYNLDEKGQNLYKILYFLKYRVNLYDKLYSYRIDLLNKINNISQDRIGEFLFGCELARFYDNCLHLYNKESKIFIDNLIKNVKTTI